MDHYFPNWRESLRQNARRTTWVILIFLVLYTGVGLIIDLFLHSYFYTTLADGTVVTYTPLQVLAQIARLQIIPYATLLMLGIAGISLYVTYALYDRIMLLGTEYREITPETAKTLAEKQLYNVIEEMKVAAGLAYMPKVFLIEADYMNAFASGYSEKSAMVAITRGLMEKLNRQELQAVMAHELSHIRHGDIKLTLTASVLANLMLMAIDMLFYSVMFSNRGRDDDRRGANALVLLVVVLRFLLPLVTVLLMLYLSRTREYMADAGCVELQRDNGPLISALLKIHEDHQNARDRYAAEYAATPHEAVRREAYIYDPVSMGLREGSSPSDWFSTHPPLHQRLAALGYQGTI